MFSNAFVQYLSAFLLMSQSVLGVELTFDLPDSARDCFHEEVKKNTTVILEYQVTPIHCCSGYLENVIDIKLILFVK